MANNRTESASHIVGGSSDVALVRVALPYGIRQLIKAGPEVVVPVPSPHTLGNLIDALEVHYPSLRHTLRDQEGNRRPYIRFYACRIDISFWSWESGLPESVVQGQEPLLVVGAVSGG